MDELSRTQCLALLEEEAVAHVGVAVGDAPYVTPISYVVIGDELIFRTVPGRRLDAITVNPRVSVEVSRVDESGAWQSVIVESEARIVSDEALEADVVAALLAKYHDTSEGLLAMGSGRPFDPKPVAVAVPLGTVTGRSSGGGLSPRTRPGRL